MRQLVVLAMLVLGTAVVTEPASAAPRTAAATEMSAQGRPQIRVYPGRLLYRECAFRLVQEWRPTGLYVVPRQRCWWVRG